MIAYFDTSALVKLFLDEPGAEQAREVWESGIPLATSRLSQAELACGIAAAVRDRRYPRARLDAGILRGAFLRDRAALVEAHAAVVDAAAIVGARHGLRGMDALQLASALELRVLEPTLVSWDARQRRAAGAEGLPVYP